MDRGILPIVPTAATPRPGRSSARRWSARRLAGLTLTVTLLGTGATQAVAAHLAATEQAATRAAAEQAAREEQARQVRVADAATARLTAAAVAYASARRTEALAVARSAVEAADAVVVQAAAGLPAETVTPLDEAAAALEALIDSAPSATAVTTPFRPTVLLDPQRAVQDPSVVRSAPRADRSTVRVPAARSDAAPSDAAPSGAALSAADPSGAAGPQAPAETATSVAAASRTVAAPVPTQTPADPAATAAPGTTTTTSTVTQDLGATHVDVPVDVAQQQLAALDLGVSADMVTVAQQVVDLSAQVRAAADAAAAAAAAEAAARAAAEEAARVAAEELARTIAAVDAAPNGEIPLDLLCGVDFTEAVHLRCDAAQALDRLNAAYRADHGADLDVVSSYRSFAAQVAVKAAKGGLAATPGRSNHGRALAVDLGGFGAVGAFGDPDYLWMKEHAEEFGWHHPAAMEPGGSGPLEPWHWEFDTEDL